LEKGRKIKVEKKKKTCRGSLRKSDKKRPRNVNSSCCGKEKKLGGKTKGEVWKKSWKKKTKTQEKVKGPTAGRKSLWNPQRDAKKKKKGRD